jgi:phosphopantothenoylcysteine decarboxylase/phosphopantothenate--cysteine ligase
MFENPFVAENVAQLEKHGYCILPPDTGELACKKIGPGRMPEPEAILERIRILLAQ